MVVGLQSCVLEMLWVWYQFLYLGEQAEPACWSLQFGGSLTPLPSSVCRAGDVLASGRHWAFGILSGKLCYIFCLQNVVASLWALPAHGPSSAVTLHWWQGTVVTRGLYIKSHKAACGLWCLCLVLSCVQACFACMWAKKQMQRLQGLSQPVLTFEQLWLIISVDFSLV